ncbi:MAG TPA: hypothetical protein VGY57_10945, partial [Vicinamibacterales bacterium]|nr:hypothetical protein [Vicinamibacterales bacterium]
MTMFADARCRARLGEDRSKCAAFAQQWRTEPFCNPAISAYPSVERKSAQQIEVRQHLARAE